MINPRLFLILVTLFMFFGTRAQTKNAMGLIIGNVMDGTSNKAIAGISITAKGFPDSSRFSSTVSDKNGGFELEKVPFGFYRLTFSGIGYAGLVIDSLNVRAERFDFNLGDVKLSQKATDLSEVIVYAEKPLIESKEGKITFNVGESALSAGSSTTDLLKNMPLISNDAEGKILLKGKEPKILIDEKPTDLNAQQLADLLESLPGSSIEKIELMTNPPPQYANEAGGVINIVTRKGKIGLTGRVTLSYGTRGEGNLSANASYRNRKLAANVYAGAGANRLTGEGRSIRNNFYTDSSNTLNTSNHFLNKNLRPNLRISVDYELNKHHVLNLTTQFASNIFSNTNETEYTNINNNKILYRISQRQNKTTGDNVNPSVTFNYNFKGVNPREVFQLIANYNYGSSGNTKNYYQRFMDGNYHATGQDSSQRQQLDNRDHTYGLRLRYDKPIKKLNSLLGFGSYFTHNMFNNVQVTDFLRKLDNAFVNNPFLSNDFTFSQKVFNLRAGITVDLKKKWRITTGLQAEYTGIGFNFNTATPGNTNDYWNLLPNFTLRKDWENEWNASLAYRKSIRRPGIDELNPSVNYTDPYNLRFGNPFLLPQLADNYDFNVGTYKGKYYGNIGIGYNKVKDIIQRLRTLVAEGKTQITFANIADRKEFEASIWGGYTFSRQFRLNSSAGYTYNQYGLYDRTVNKYRNGGSFYANLNYNFILTDRISFDGNLRYNSFADPQGRSRSNLSQNLGVQTKYFNKRLVLSVNLVDLFAQQKYNNYTYGPNFSVESVNSSNTRNVRIAVSYNLNKNKRTISNRQRKQLLEKIKIKNGG